MKITIRSNGKITDGKIIKDSETDEYIDYAKMNLNKRNKMQFTKG